MKKIRKSLLEEEKITAGRPILPENLLAEQASSSNSSVEKQQTSKFSGNDESAKCFITFASYKGPDWVCCVNCIQWYCGHCNGVT